MIQEDEAWAFLIGLRGQQIDLAILVYIRGDYIWRRRMMDGPLEDCPAANDETRESMREEARRWSNELDFMEHSGCDLQLGTGEELCCCLSFSEQKMKIVLRIKQYRLEHLAGATSFPQPRVGLAHIFCLRRRLRGAGAD